MRPGEQLSLEPESSALGFRKSEIRVSKGYLSLLPGIILS